MPAVLVLLLFACLLPPALAHPARWQAHAAPDLVLALAKRHAVADDGAMGRNREAYFHARFQMGVHQLAAAAVMRRDPELASRTLDAIEYAFARQRADGGFEAVVPAALRGQRPPGETDLASGSAFFLASAAEALIRLEPVSGDPPWLPADTAARAKALRPKLALSLAYLRRHQAALLAADARAPNRLLFNALAFRGLGYLLGDEPLGKALGRALAWQRTRISAEGEILTEGNTRVRDGGESFLGVEKAVDAAHAVEALMLSAAWRGAPDDLVLARAVARHYGRSRRP
jgi:hypothetical protein